MKRLREDAQRLFDRARHAHDPPPDAKARTRGRLQARLAAGAVIGAGAVVSKTTLALGVGALGKAPLITLLLAGAAGLGYGVGTFIDAPQVSVPKRQKDVRRLPLSATTHQSSAVDAPRSPLAQPLSTVVAAAPIKAVAPLVRTGPSAARDALVDESPAPSPVASLVIETQLIRQANQAIASGDCTRALALSGEHERRFPGGVLTEERVAMQVIAYCRLGRRSEAQARLQQFASKWPNSPHWPRINSACGPLDATLQK